MDLLTFFIPFSESLPALEKGEMKKDYNANTTGGDSEDEEDPRTPTSVSSQGSQGYDSAGSDFVDIEGFSQITPLPDSSLPEISLQVSTFFYVKLMQKKKIVGCLNLGYCNATFLIIIFPTL